MDSLIPSLAGWRNEGRLGARRECKDLAKLWLRWLFEKLWIDNDRNNSTFMVVKSLAEFRCKVSFIHLLETHHLF